MKAADTSLVIAAFASWHEHHEAARSALDSGLRLIDHCALETYSVLTRLPPPHRAAGTVVRDFMAARFPGPSLRLNASAYGSFYFLYSTMVWLVAAPRTLWSPRPQPLALPNWLPAVDVPFQFMSAMASERGCFLEH